MNIQLDNLPETKKKAIERFVQELREKYRDRVNKIILFGSVARGNFREESDIDILVIGTTTLEEIIDISYPILLEFGELILPHVMDENHYTMLRKNKSGFIESIEREGIIIV
ncbi:nucleotidyltransferase domain-containing protein [Archaeoglobales archaeon]|nr:MAG: nucleotidyltransferase domain-containing protein [Archaeoglobales archaeon]